MSYQFLLESLKTYEVTRYFGEALKWAYGGNLPRLFISPDVRDIHLYVLWKNEPNRVEQEMDSFGNKFKKWSIEQFDLDRYDADLVEIDVRTDVMKIDEDTLNDWMDNNMGILNLDSEADCLESIEFMGDPDLIIDAERVYYSECVECMGELVPTNLNAIPICKSCESDMMKKDKYQEVSDA